MSIHISQGMDKKRGGKGWDKRKRHTHPLRPRPRPCCTAAAKTCTHRPVHRYTCTWIQYLCKNIYARTDLGWFGNQGGGGFNPPLWYKFVCTREISSCTNQIQSFDLWGNRPGTNEFVARDWVESSQSKTPETPTQSEHTQTHTYPAKGWHNVYVYIFGIYICR